MPRPRTKREAEGCMNGPYHPGTGQMKIRSNDAAFVAIVGLQLSKCYGVDEGSICLAFL
jgi:hypothetical protein